MLDSCSRASTWCRGEPRASCAELRPRAIAIAGCRRSLQARSAIEREHYLCCVFAASAPSAPTRRRSAASGNRCTFRSTIPWGGATAVAAVPRIFASSAVRDRHAGPRIRAPSDVHVWCAGALRVGCRDAPTVANGTVAVSQRATSAARATPARAAPERG